MIRRRHLVATLLLLAGCSGGQEAELYCPRVAAVAGLDRVAVSYPGATAPVPTRLDIIDVACVTDGDDLLVGNVLAVQLGRNRPAGVVEVPYTLVLDTPEGPRDARSEVVVVPAGAVGTTAYFEHRFAGLANRDDVAVRLLYALVPDEPTRARLAEERPRP